MGNADEALLRAPSSFPQLLEQALGDTTKANVLKLSVPTTIMPKSLLYTQILIYFLRIAVLQSLPNLGIRQKHAGDMSRASLISALFPPAK